MRRNRPSDGPPPECDTCHHSSSHTGGGIGVCLTSGCGCDGPCDLANPVTWIDDDRPKSRYSVIMRKQWTDKEPDTLSVEVCTSSTTGEAFVVFTCSSTWLNSKQAEEVMDYLGGCIGKVNDYNAHQHMEHCCSEHKTHVTPHKECVLR